MDVPYVHMYRRTRPTRACPLAVSRYRAAFLVRIPFISVLPSAHGSKWLPGRTLRARTSRRSVVSSCVIEIPCDEKMYVTYNGETSATRIDSWRRSQTLAVATAATAATAAAHSLDRRVNHVLTSRPTRACTSRVFCVASRAKPVHCRQVDLPEEDKP